MAIELDGTVACVTGAGRGIGLAIADALIASGAHVFLGDIDGDLVRNAAESLGENATGVTLDVTDPESFDAFLNTARATGPISLLVNNAGLMRTGTFVEQDPASQQHELAVNLGGVITGMRLALPPMVAANHGHIVNVASMAGKITTPGASIYTASKFGVVALSRAVRAELAGTNVSVTTIVPAAVKTDLTAGLDTSIMPVSDPADVARAVIDSCRKPRAEIGVPRWITPIGQAVEVLPEAIGERAKRLAGAQRRLTPDNAAARAYQDRL